MLTFVEIPDFFGQAYRYRREGSGMIKIIILKIFLKQPQS
jgi:hypothetical protein